MTFLLDRCRFNPAAGGTTDWAVSSAVTGYQTPALAGAVNGSTYRYAAESNDLSQWEIGTGVYNTTGPVLSRAGVLYNSSGSGTGAGQSGAGTKINFSTAPQVAITALAEDLVIGSSDSTIEYDLGAGSAVTMTSGSISNIVSGSIPVGRWLLWGNVVYSAQGSTAYTEVHASVSATSGAVDTSPGSSNAFHVTFITGQAAIIPTSFKVVTLTTPTTYYLTATVTNTGSAMLAYGSLFGVKLGQS